MKHYIYLFLALFILSACENNEIPAPYAEFSVVSDTATTFERIEFTNLGSGQYYTYFTGDEGHVFEKRNEGHTGFSGDLKGNFNYSYTSSGPHDVTLLVTTYDPESKNVKESVFKKTIFVKDNPEYFKLDMLVFKNLGLYNYSEDDAEQLTAEALTNNFVNYSVLLYNYHRYLGDDAFYTGVSEVETKPSHLISYQTNISIEGVSNFNDGITKVNYTASEGNYYVPKKHYLESGAENIKELNVCLLQIPEFSSFSIADTTLENVFFYDKRKRRSVLSPFTVDYTNIHHFNL